MPAQHSAAGCARQTWERRQPGCLEALDCFGFLCCSASATKTLKRRKACRTCTISLPCLHRVRIFTRRVPAPLQNFRAFPRGSINTSARKASTDYNHHHQHKHIRLRLPLNPQWLSSGSLPRPRRRPRPRATPARTWKSHKANSLATAYQISSSHRQMTFWQYQAGTRKYTYTVSTTMVLKGSGLSSARAMF